MSWNSRFTHNPAEVGAALREQSRQEQQRAMERLRAMSGLDKSPTGIVRGRYKFGEAKSAVGSLNQKLDEAIDEVRLAFQREASVNQADEMTRETDAQRAPVLGNRGAVQ